MRVASITLLATIAVFAAGCGAVNHIPNSEATPQNASIGKALFISSSCSGCHTLADAKTSGTIGPNLDDAFASDKQQGFQESTIRDVVRGQIAYATADPGQIDPESKTNPPAASAGMPDNILRGQQARDVAIYVAMCSANPSCGITAASAKLVAATPG